jgi:deazaflavin-dependent oxidoreductase (nitroreductase family)
MNLTRYIFLYLNKYFMVPMFQLGFGFLIGNPLTGYIMVLKHTGRKTGLLRYTPVNYVIIDGHLYCIAGFGKRSHWYLNIQTNPKLEIMLPGRTIYAQAEEVTDPDEALLATKQIFKNAGFAGFFEGYNPYTAPDKKFQETLQRAPVLRMHQTGIGAGPADPGGRLWLSLTIGALAIILLVLLG